MKKYLIYQPGLGWEKSIFDYVAALFTMILSAIRQAGAHLELQQDPEKSSSRWDSNLRSSTFLLLSTKFCSQGS